MWKSESMYKVEHSLHMHIYAFDIPRTHGM
jgi:hypothetical protein